MTDSTSSSEPPEYGQSVYDGVICFGGVDWWYHNRGHYDLQMMREFSKSLPVIYINSIGMRPPQISEGKMFFRRVLRKLRSLRQGLVTIRPNYYVFSPASFPGGGRNNFSRLIAKKLLSFQVKRAARQCGIHKPLVWVACPPAAAVVDDLKPAQVVYQRTDRFENFAGVDSNGIRNFDQFLKNRADLVLFCARELFEAEKDSCNSAAFIDHGVDYGQFEAAGIDAENNQPEPTDLADIPRPRVGFVGSIDGHTFDPALFVEVAGLLPELQFVLVGGCSLPSGWCTLENVHHLGQRPYEAVPAYMAASDVLIMPWNKSDWIKACNPVKTKEYLAVGRPIVSTYFPEVVFYKEFIAIADSASQFSDAIRRAVSDPGEAGPRRARVQSHTWSAKADLVRQSLIKLN